MSITAGLPPRPDEAASQRRVERRWIPAIAVASVILVLSAGAHMVGDRLAGVQGPPVVVPGVVTVQPRPGWEVAERSDDGTTHQLVLRRGTAGLLVVGIEAFGGGPGDLAHDYTVEVLDQHLAQLRIGGDAGAVVLPSGLEAVRFGYVGVTGDGVTIEGVVTAVVAPSGNGVVFDGFSPQGDLASAAGDLFSMIDSAAVA